MRPIGQRRLGFRPHFELAQRRGVVIQWIGTRSGTLIEHGLREDRRVGGIGRNVVDRRDVGRLAANGAQNGKDADRDQQRDQRQQPALAGLAQQDDDQRDQADKRHDAQQDRPGLDRQGKQAGPPIPQAELGPQRGDGEIHW